MCTLMHIFVTKWCIVDMGLVQYGICEYSLLYLHSVSFFDINMAR